MSEWSRKSDLQGASDVYDNDRWITNCHYGVSARNVVDAHNADCDTYEASIAELTAELARVKAESLRVVADGGPVTVFRLDGNDKFILHNGETYYRSGEAFICTNNRIVGRIEDDTIVQPVRLERWEGRDDE